MNRRIFSLLFVSALTCACAMPAADGPEGEGDVTSSTEGLQAVHLIRPVTIRTLGMIVQDLASEVDSMDSGVLVYFNTSDPLVRATAVADVRSRLTRSISLADELLRVASNPDMVSTIMGLRASLLEASSYVANTELEMLKLQSTMSARAQALHLVTNMLKALSEAQSTVVGNMK